MNDSDLWDPADHAGMRRMIEDGTIEEWGRAFPAEYGGVRVEAKNLRYSGKPVFSLKDQKKAWMENRELGRSLKADLELYDRETGEQIDARPDTTLMRVPHYTDRGTFVYNGNNYSACFHGMTKIWTEEGWVEIYKIVSGKRKIRVWSWDFKEGRLVLKPVVNWFKRPGVTQRLRFDSDQGMFPALMRGGTNFTSVRCTEDHMMYAPDGSKTAAGKCSRVAMVEERLNGTQRQMVLGSLLGDGTIQSPGIFRSSHCGRQREYNEIKRTILGSFVASNTELKVSKCLSVDRITEGVKNSFHTCSSVAFKELRDSIYPHGVRCLDTDWHRECGEMALAFWFCDDGSSRYQRQKGELTNSPCVTLHTENFSVGDVEKLREFLTERWGLSSSVCKKSPPKGGRTKFNASINRNILLTGNSAWEFLELVAPWVPDCLSYKLLTPPHTKSCRCGKAIEAKREKCSDCYMEEIRGCPGSLSKSIRSLYGSSAVARELAAKGNHGFDDTRTLSRWKSLAERQGTGLAAAMGDNTPVQGLVSVSVVDFDDAAGTKLARARTVYDLEVEDTHNYFANGLLVSNCNQARMVPGIYTRRQNNGALESQINTRSGTGRVFRVGLDQDTGQFRLKIAGSNLHLYSVLKDSGVTDGELADAWGPDILDMNRGKYDARAITKAFQKFVPRYLQGQVQDDADRGSLLLDALNKAQVSKEATDRTLAAYWKPRDVEKAAGQEVRSMLRLFFPAKKAADANFSAGFDIRSKLGDVDDEGDVYRPVGLDGLLASTRKLLAVNRGLDRVDERSIPTFTKVYTMDKLMRERIRFDEGKIRRNLMRMINSRRSLSPVHHRVFDPYYKEIITKNPLTTPIEETNPMQLLGQQRRITHMGPGGIGSTDALTADMTAIQANEMGYYSTLEGPEAGTAGVDVRLSWGAKIGRDGRMRRPLLNRRTGVVEQVSPGQLFDKFLKLPD